jgi:hypothetical protein
MKGAAMPPQTVPQPPAPSFPDDRAVLDQLLSNLEQVRGCPAIVYWTSQVARISIAAEMSLFDQLSALGGHQPALDLVLCTNGGDPEAPWRFVCLIREFCDKFSVLLPHHAYSAGTMFAMGADEIVMSPLSVLGPIDPSRTHPLLPKREGAKEGEPISVQDMRHAMQFIRDAGPAGVSYTPEAMASIFAALFDKIHPLAIGAIEQTYALAKLIGKRSLETHMDPATEGPQIEAIVNRLCDDYKSHAYQISRREAKLIGLKVTDAKPTEESALLDLLRFYSSRPLVGGTAPPKPGQQIKMQIAWLDSIRKKFRAEQQAVVNADTSIEPRGDQWLSY